MSLGQPLYDNPDLWGPWYVFPLAIALFLTGFFILAFAERRLFDGIEAVPQTNHRTQMKVLTHDSKST